MKNVTKTNKIILTLVVGMSFFISACGETPSEVQSPLVGTVEKMKPIAKALALNMLEDSSATGQLAGEAKEQGTLSFEIVSLPAHGSIANFDSNLGSFDYLPNANFNGSDSLQFIAKEGDLKSEVTLLPIVITPVNDAPIAASMPFSLNEDVRTEGQLTGSDIDGDVLSYDILSQPSNGSLTSDASGRFAYTPNAEFHGSDSFTYRVSDGLIQTEMATVSIVVDSINDAPVANPLNVSLDEDSAPLQRQLQASDADGDALTYAIVQQGEKGSVTVDALGMFTYTPSLNANGDDSFTFRASDGSSESNIETVLISINPINDAPIALPIEISTLEDNALDRVHTDLDMSMGVDLDKDALTYETVTGPMHGTVSMEANGSFHYEPISNYSGADSFSYRVSDGQLSSNVATVTVSVESVNDAPFASDITTAVDLLAAVTIDPVMGDVDSNALTVEIVSQPLEGTTSINGQGKIVYQAGSNVGDFSFQYRAFDGILYSEVQTVSIQVKNNPFNGSFLANGLTATGLPYTTCNNSTIVIEKSNTQLKVKAHSYKCGYSSVYYDNDTIYSIQSDGKIYKGTQLVGKVSSDKLNIDYYAGPLRFSFIIDYTAGGEATFLERSASVVISGKIHKN